MYDGLLKPSDFTPSGPDDLEVHIDVRTNIKGDLEPVIVAKWKAKDDGALPIRDVSCLLCIRCTR